MECGPLDEVMVAVPHVDGKPNGKVGIVLAAVDVMVHTGGSGGRSAVRAGPGDETGADGAFVRSSRRRGLGEWRARLLRAPLGHGIVYLRNRKSSSTQESRRASELSGSKCVMSRDTVIRRTEDQGHGAGRNPR